MVNQHFRLDVECVLGVRGFPPRRVGLGICFMFCPHRVKHSDALASVIASTSSVVLPVRFSFGSMKAVNVRQERAVRSFSCSVATQDTQQSAQDFDVRSCAFGRHSTVSDTHKRFQARLVVLRIRHSKRAPPGLPLLHPSPHLPACDRTLSC